MSLGGGWRERGGGRGGVGRERGKERGREREEGEGGSELTMC
jgi:hypothetical protein